MPRHVGKRPIREDTHFAAMASTWNKEETKKLIEICGDGVMQAQLEGCKHNQEVYDKIAKDPIEAGYQRSGKQCRDKIKNLKGEYRNMQSQLGHLGIPASFASFVAMTPIPVLLGEGSMLLHSASVTENNQLPDAPTCSTSLDLFEETQVDADESTSRPDTSCHP